ncbi:acyltransferase [Gemmata sp. JC717]|uniref:acyltransferase family protein n=1 Tax=Gemmata algarum TaxID=2975278 RepID=UPI0021BBA80F|nr:acyltransferase [Gemmata algarum]MDY3554750.1 acyltransferase [Gemmata algarum]
MPRPTDPLDGAVGPSRPIDNTTPGGRLDRLDGLRAIACLMVYWHHTGTAIAWPPVAVYGSSGVYLFFVLSGYLLFRPAVTAVRADAPWTAVGQFYLRRVIRIWPPYFVALILYMAARAVTGQTMPNLGEFAARLFLLSGYFPDYNFFGVCAVFWTLAIEAQFYLLLPLVTRMSLAVSRGRVGAAPVVFIAIGLIARLAEGTIHEHLYGANTQVIYRSALSYFDLFGYGMAVAAMEKTGRLRRLPLWLWLTAAAAVVLITNGWQTAHGEWISSGRQWYANAYPPLIGLAAAAILTAVLNSSAYWVRWLTAAPVRFVGRISYSLYLYHIGVQFALFQFVNLTPWISHFHARGFVYGLLFLGPTLVVSAVMFYLIERPCLRWAGAIRATATPTRQ